MLNKFIKKMTGQNVSSSEAAKKRLKFALVYDSLEVSDETLELLKRDIVEVLSNYFEIDKQETSIDIERSNEYSSLVLNTPIFAARRRP